MAAIDRLNGLASETTLAIKAPCLVATTGANITLSGAQVIDGVTVGNSSERVLVKDQTDPTQNGIYIASSGNWLYAQDAGGNTDWAQGTQVLVNSGIVNANSLFRQSTSAVPIVIGSNALSFAVVTAPFAGTGRNATAVGFSAAQQALWLVGTYTGSGPGPYAEVSVTDTATNTQVGTALVGWRVDHSFGGAGTGAGSRNAIQSILNVTGPTPLVGGNPDVFKFYTAVFGQSYAFANDNGTSPAPHGLLYGLAGLAQLSAGATFWSQVIGAEFNVSVQAGASVAYKSCLSLINVNSDAVNGSVFDAALVFTSDGSTTARWAYGISFGRPDSLWSFNTSSTLIGTVAPSAGSRVANHGIDFSAVTFSGMAFRSNNFSVDQNGNITAGLVSINGASGGFVMNSRTGSGESLQWYNPSGTGAALFNGTRNIAVFDVSNDGSLAIVGPFSATGATFSALLQTAASATGSAGINLPAGTAPTSPNNGDFWFDGTNFKARVGGVTKTFTIS